MVRKYLVVDDNVAFAENVAEILTDAGAEVSVATGADAALEHIKSTRFDGLVTDMRMPGVSGAELLRQIRTLDPGIPVVLLSAWAQDAQLDEAKRWGLLAFLSKASGMVKLLDLLEHARRDATLVLLDNDRVATDTLAEMLTQHGFTVCTVATVTELEALAIKPFAALIDIQMPEMLDAALIDRVKELLPQTPLLIATAQREFINTHDLEVVASPFDPTHVLIRLEALVHKAVPA